MIGYTPEKTETWNLQTVSFFLGRNKFSSKISTKTGETVHFLGVSNPTGLVHRGYVSGGNLDLKPTGCKCYLPQKKICQQYKNDKKKIWRTFLQTILKTSKPIKTY